MKFTPYIYIYIYIYIYSSYLKTDYLDTLSCKRVNWHLLTTKMVKELWCRAVEKMLYVPDGDMCCEGKLFATFYDILCFI